MAFQCAVDNCVGCTYLIAERYSHLADQHVTSKKAKTQNSRFFSFSFSSFPHKLDGCCGKLNVNSADQTAVCGSVEVIVMVQ
jgi:hypothetical protein